MTELVACGFNKYPDSLRYLSNVSFQKSSVLNMSGT